MYSYLLKFVIAESAFQVSPGPDMALVLRSALKGNLRLAWGCVVGIMISSLIWGAASAIGLCALIAISPKAFNILAVIGISWLAWLGIQMVFTRNASFLGKTQEKNISETSSGFFSGITQGLMTDLLNPTTAIFILTFFPAFIPPGYNPSYFSLLLGFIMALDTLVFSGGMVLLAKPLTPFIARPQIALWIDRIAGVIFIFLSYQLFCEAGLNTKSLELLHHFL